METILEINVKINPADLENTIDELKKALEAQNGISTVEVAKSNKKQLSGLDIGVSLVVSIAANFAYKVLEEKLNSLLKKYKDNKKIEESHITKITPNE